MNIYLCCGTNGILPLEDVSFYYAQKCLNTYLYGPRIVRKATSRLQACKIIEKHIADVCPWKEAPQEFTPGQFIRLRELPNREDWTPPSIERMSASSSQTE